MNLTHPLCLTFFFKVILLLFNHHYFIGWGEINSYSRTLRKLIARKDPDYLYWITI